MPLIKCPECDHNVSTEASQCPSCGFNLKKKDNPAGSGCALIIFGLLVCLLFPPIGILVIVVGLIFLVVGMLR